MGSCYSGDHIAGGHIQTDITNVTPRNHKRSTALEWSVMDYWGGGVNISYVLLAQIGPSASSVGQNIWSA